MQALADYNKSPYDVDASKVAFQEVYERWSEEHFPTVSESNTKGYRTAYLLCESIANKRMVDVKLDDLQYITDTSSKNTPTLRKYKVLVGLMFKHVVIHNIISPDMNKRQYIDIKKAGNPSAYNWEPFSKVEIEKVWKWKDTNGYFNVILMLIYSGCRISELLNLKKENVNIKEHWFDVTAAKTEAEIRKVPISDKVYLSLNIGII